MCYGCSMCNSCGKFDRLAALQRRCPSCKKEPPPEDLVCPECGTRLPPPFPNSPSEPASKRMAKAKEPEATE